MPLRFMSRIRSSMSYAPGRISAKVVGSMPHSSLGQPTTALRLPEPLETPWNHQRSIPSSPSTDLGA